MQIVKVEPLARTNVVLRIRANEGRRLEYNIDGLRMGGWLGERSIAPREKNTGARTPHYLLNHRVAAKSQAAAPLGNSFCLNTAEAGLKIAPFPPHLTSPLPLRARRVHYAK